jgi:catechol 2,3-dioxygenase-like lactoylglutathione lyase family enzyme
MVSLVTDGLDEWHARLREAGVEILSEPADSESAPVRAFLARDPGGYTIEFFRWLDR